MRLNYKLWIINLYSFIVSDESGWRKCYICNWKEKVWIRLELGIDEYLVYSSSRVTLSLFRRSVGLGPPTQVLQP